METLTVDGLKYPVVARRNYSTTGGDPYEIVTLMTKSEFTLGGPTYRQAEVWLNGEVKWKEDTRK